MNKSDKYYLRKGKLELSMLDEDDDDDDITEVNSPERKSIISPKKQKQEEMLRELNIQHTKRLRDNKGKSKVKVSNEIYNTLHAMGQYLTKNEESTNSLPVKKPVNSAKAQLIEELASNVKVQAMDLPPLASKEERMKQMTITKDDQIKEVSLEVGLRNKEEIDVAARKKLDDTIALSKLEQDTINEARTLPAEAFKEEEAPTYKVVPQTKDESIQEKQVMRQARHEEIQEDQVMQQIRHEELQEEQVMQQIRHEEIQEDQVMQQARHEELQEDQVMQQARHEEIQEDQVMQQARHEELQEDQVIQQARHEELQEDQVIQQARHEELQEDQVMQQAEHEKLQEEQVMQQTVATKEEDPFEGPIPEDELEMDAGEVRKIILNEIAGPIPKFRTHHQVQESADQLINRFFGQRVPQYSFTKDLKKHVDEQIAHLNEELEEWKV